MKQTLFLGPPGTGKTTRLLDEVDKLFKQGYSPREIAFVSFTKKAANEAKERALAKFNHLSPADFHHWSTLHSLCFKRLHLEKKAVMQRENWLEIADKVGAPMRGYYNVDDGFLAAGTDEGDKFLFHYGLAHARKMEPAQHYETLDPGERWDISKPKFLYFCQTLAAYKKATGLLDFSDMLEQGVYTGPVPEVRIAFIDEAQDLSLRQWEVARSLFQNCERLMIAGDDDQSIFEWSGADIDTFLNLGGEQIVLEKSFRLPRRIFEFANRIVGRLSQRLEKHWHPDEREGSVKTIRYLRQLRDDIVRDDGQTWLVLARNKYLLNEQISDLRAWGVPYAEKGKPAIAAADMRAIRAYEGCRTGKGIPVGDAQAFYDFLKGTVDVKRGYKRLPESAPEIVNWNWLETDGGLKVDRNAPWFDVLNIRQDRKSYYRAIRRHGYSTTGTPKVNCSTIHGVKGGEADNVILIDAMARRTYREFTEVNPDAEHRVQYVGATRAKENLFILQSGEPSHYPFSFA